MGYYVTLPSGEEKGPYEEAHIREWLRSGTMPANAPVRLEHETTGRPASEVFPGEHAPPAGTPFGSPSAGPVGAAPNVYAPPIQTETTEWVSQNTGSFGTGFVFGFFCGCIALIWSYVSKDMGSETKRGVRMGFITGMAIGFVIRLIGLLAR